MMSDSVNKQYADRFQAIIPWGASTCSKAPTLLPEEPAVIVRGEGCRVWDADGREFIDFRNGLGPVTLGYKYPAVDEAIRRQLDDGILYGHPHPLECEVAELIVEMVPCAEKARFLKTGGEAMAACLRIARHYTGRDHIVQIGYNGWLNSLAHNTRVLPGAGRQVEAVPGVPECVGDLHHSAEWNDAETLQQLFDSLPGQIAAVVVAADYEQMADCKTFYPFLRELTQRHGSLLIYDEIVTGFRIAVGGIQAYSGVLPDLAVFSKAFANGMPLSVYTGRKDVMEACERGGAVISSTFAGEALSLAAAKAVLLTYRDHDVIGHLWKQGQLMWEGANRLFGQYRLPVQVKGFWPCPMFVFEPAAAGLRDAFFRESYRQGLSFYNVSYVNFSHAERDIEEALQRLDVVCQTLSAR